jgi:DNA helicase-2/ATP-dependent DNA helicase PcrA
MITCGTADEQASFVAQRMVELLDEGMDLKDIAVLYRAHWHSMELQMELTRRNIPFQVRSGLRFFEQAHVKDVVAFLKVLGNPLDELAWKRILKLYPKIGRKTAERIYVALVKSGDPLGLLGSEEILGAVPKAARAGWKDLRGILKALQVPAVRKAPGEMIRTVLEGGYETYLSANYANASARAEDIRRFADYSMRFNELEKLLSELALTSSVTAEDSVEEYEDTDWTVLSTVHQAKGLEWRAVFIIWLVDGKFPDARAIREQDGEEEERRLFYVASTRAKDQLYLVHPTLADERGLMGVIQRPSRFTAELESETFEQTVAGYSFD